MREREPCLRVWCAARGRRRRREVKGAGGLWLRARVRPCAATAKGRGPKRVSEVEPTRQREAGGMGSVGSRVAAARSLCCVGPTRQRVGMLQSGRRGGNMSSWTIRHGRKLWPGALVGFANATHGYLCSYCAVLTYFVLPTKPVP